MNGRTFDSAEAGNRMAELRRQRGITQEALAERLGVSPQSVSKWENGRTTPDAPHLVALSSVLGCSIDEILLPGVHPAAGANFEYILLPYAPIAEFTGRKWPRSMGGAALMAALKLFMGLEGHRDSRNRQINDDAEYILQAAYSGVCFAYSYGRTDEVRMYGLECEKLACGRQPEQALIDSAVRSIRRGYPVILRPHAYADMILATGFSDGGRTLKGIPFLDGDDDKNSAMSFDRLRDYPGWYRDEGDLQMIRPGGGAMRAEEVCAEALMRGYAMLSNVRHVGPEPLVGYGLVIYDNWCALIDGWRRGESDAVACIYPHIFIHYEGKLRTREFLELCARLMDGVDREALLSAAARYQEIVDICEALIPKLTAEYPASEADVYGLRQQFLRCLQRSRELEADALNYMRRAVESLGR